MLTASPKSCDAFSRSASLYDQHHSGRDYDRDLKLLAPYIAEALQRQQPADRRTLVDWGAGTGEHVRRWQARGFQAVGFDYSPQMSMAAQAKGNFVLPGDICETDPTAASSGGVGDLESKRISEIKPATIQTCLFAAFSCATVDDVALHAALANVRKWGSPGGIFCFDVVSYAACASALRPKQVRQLPGGSCTMLKRFDPVAGIMTADLNYDVDGDVFTERHRMRAFTPHEIKMALQRSRFEVVDQFDPEAEAARGDGAIRTDSYYFMTVAMLR